MIVRALFVCTIFAIILMTFILIDWAYRQWCAWSDKQDTLKRDLKVALETVAQLRLQLALAQVAMNMRETALSVRKRSRGLWVAK